MFPGAVFGPLLAQTAGLSTAVNTATLLAVAGAILTGWVAPSVPAPRFL